jgi:hypothetical protein
LKNREGEVAKPAIQFYERVCAAGEFLALNVFPQAEKPDKIHVLVLDFYRRRGRPVKDRVYHGLLSNMDDPCLIRMNNRGLHVILWMACYRGRKPGPFHRSVHYHALPVMVT